MHMGSGCDVARFSGAKVLESSLVLLHILHVAVSSQCAIEKYSTPTSISDINPRPPAPPASLPATLTCPNPSSQAPLTAHTPAPPPLITCP